MWYVEPVFDAAHNAVLSNGKPLVYVCPPAGWCVEPLFKQLGDADTFTLILIPDGHDPADLAAVWSRAVGYAHPLTGLTRTASLLEAEAVSTLAASVEDVSELLATSRFKVDVGRVVVAWPELMPDPDARDHLLAQIGSGHRVVVTSDPAASADFLKHQAHRAPVLEWAPLPTAPVRDVDYAVTPPPDERVLRRVLDLLNEPHVVVWDPTERLGDVGPGVVINGEPPDTGTVVLTELPNERVLQTLPAAVRVVALVRANQLSHLKTAARLGKALKFSVAHDRARAAMGQLRKQLRHQAEQANHALELAAIEPLLDEFDPADLAAAALKMQPAPATPTDKSTWTRIHVNAGLKDRVRAGDLVGLLLNVGGLKKANIGRVDLRDAYALVEVRPDDAAAAAGALTGQSIRGKRIAARPDRK